MVLSNIYDAICDPSNLYDFVLPSLAILAGAKRIYVRPGTYNESKTISVPQGTTITGAQVDTTIIDFGNNAASLVSDSGYGTAVSNGTISVTQGSNVITGTGTTFLTSLVAAGQYIIIDKNAYLITAVTSNTSLQITYPFRGQSASGLSYKALAMFSGLEVSNLTIRNSLAPGLRLAGNRRARIRNLVFRNCANNVVLQDCAECSGKMVNSSYSTVSGMQIIDTDSCNFKDLFLTSNVGDGLIVSGSCSGLRMRSVDAANNGGNGITLNATELANVIVSESTLSNNVQNGFAANNACDTVVVTTTDCENNGATGIAYAGNNGKFMSCTVSFNTNLGIDISGDDCVVNGCSSTGGALQPITVQISGARNVVSASSFTNNTLNAVYLTAVASYCLVVGCNLSGAGDQPIRDDSTYSYSNVNME